MSEANDPAELANALRRIAKISYGATIEEGRSVSRTQRDAADALEANAALIALLRASLRQSEDEVDGLRRDAVRLDALEEAAKVCDEFAIDRWNLYKGRAPYNGSEDGRANSYVEGESDGADTCAAAIRALSQPSGREA